jgi:PEP-CTERM motif
MKRRNGLTLAAVVLLFSACSLASTITDPGGIIRSGSDYSNFAIIHENLTITFNGMVLNNGFNPFDFTGSFCPMDEGTFQNGTVSGPDCQFINESDQTINNVFQFFHATGDQLSPFFCDNQITGEPCSIGPNGNALLFTGLGIPPLEEYSAISTDAPLNTDPEFNILLFGLTRDLAQIDHMSIPEPASLGLMLSGLFGLGLVWKRKAHAKRQ